MSRIPPCGLAGLVLAAAAASAADLRLDGDRIHLRADHDSLQGVLADFVRLGVEVRAEPGIDAHLHGTLDGVPIDEGLRTLLESFNYILYWDRVDGPAGRLTRLAAIHLFRPGHPERAVPFQPDGDDSNLVVVRIPGVPAHVKDEILLGVRPGTSPRQFRDLLASIGGTVVSSVPALGVYQVRLPRDSNVPVIARGVAGNPWVATAEPNYVHELPPPVPAGRGIPVPAAPGPVADGAARVAVFDSGLVALPQLGEAVVGAFDAVEPGRDMDDPVGHGTQMALVASGAVQPGGVSPAEGAAATPVLAVRAFDDNGMASNFSLLRGIDYAVGEGARVVSLSWGTEVDSAFLGHAVAYAQDRGLVVVASAGNQPTGQPVYPAAYHGVVAVTALLPDGSVWENANHGDFITVAAPGTGEFPVGYNGPPGTYAGTSIAAAYVARAVGRYLDRHPAATPVEAVAAVRAAATDAGEPGPDPAYGAGALDDEALQRLLAE